jgi:hypothetical protein
MTDVAGLLMNSDFAYHVPTLLAQSSAADEAAATAVAGGVNLVTLLFYVAVYAFTSFCGQKILNTLNYENSWLAWVPVANVYAYLEAGEQEQPLLWTILSIIPCVGLISLIKIIPAWINICNQLGKTPWILLAVFIPCAGPFVLFGYLAFA